jgi:hypothetical protein
MRNFLMLLTLVATGLLAGCPAVVGTYACGGVATKAGRDCEESRKKELDEFNKKKNGETLSLKGALQDDSLCHKNPAAGEKPCAAAPTGK